jgi:thiol-disulfide isomerase/thioredoxin
MITARFLTSLLIALVLGVPVTFAQTDNQALLNAGDQSIREGKYDQAYKTYEKANKFLGEKCSACMVKMAIAKLYLHDEAGAMKLTDRALTAAVDAGQRADAYATKGQILLAIGANDAKKLAVAEDAFRSARKEDPASDILQLRLGNVLLRENKIDEGKAQLEDYLKRHPKGSESDVARRWLDHPTKVQFALSPEFEVTTINGQTLSSKTLAGRVVVIDFWATWCPPCRASVPELKDLTAKYPSDKLIIVSVSSDKDQDQWKKFVADKNMSWPQYIDSDHHMTKIFDVNAFPTYIIIDGDGFVRERLMSFDPRESLAHRLKEPLKKMLE